MTAGNDLHYPKGINITGCSSCGGDHLFLPVREPVAGPRVIGGATYAHYTLCPKTREVVYIRFDDDGISSVSAVEPIFSSEPAVTTLTDGEVAQRGSPVRPDADGEYDLAGIAEMIKHPLSEWAKEYVPQVLYANLVDAMKRIADLEDKISALEGGK
jgi:hypothetical protein